jgi:branched-chain amino acid aminotransferase
MVVFLNGKFVPEADATVPITDRGFLYGDGLFETLRVYRGVPFRWASHLRRLHHGLKALGIVCPTNDAMLRAAAGELIENNQAADSILRIQMTRGSGQRGYASTGADKPTLVMTTHSAPAIASRPPVWTLATSRFRIESDNPLNGVKSSNKLINVLAKDEAAQAGADEAILLNERDEVVETSSANLFWIQGDTVRTPPLASGSLPGVTREVVMEICEALEIPCYEYPCEPATLRTASGVFLTLSSWGIVEADSVDGMPLLRSPLIQRLVAAYREVVERETRPADNRANRP